MLAAHCDRNGTSWAAALEGPDETALEQLRAYLVKSARFVRGDPDRLGCMVTGFVVEGVDHDPQAGERVRRALRGIEGSLAECVQAARRRGDLGPEVDASEISQLLMAVNGGMEVMARAGLGAAALERVADHAFGGRPLMATRVPGRCLAQGFPALPARTAAHLGPGA